jgi:hypothetical protein
MENKITREELMKWSKDRLIDFILNEKQFWIDMLQSFNPKVRRDDNDNLVDDSLKVPRIEAIKVTNSHELIDAINKLDKRKIIIFDERIPNLGSSLAVPREASIPNTIIKIRNSLKGGKNKENGKRRRRR